MNMFSDQVKEREEAVLNFWNQEKVFEKSLKTEKPLFSTYDGPPFATGLPHYGHLIAGTIKDVIPRYKTMKGFYVPRRFGWDCHGLPVEHEIEKSFELSGAASIEKFGIARFNEECRLIVLRYTEEWKATVRRMGRWVDLDHVFRTMDLSFMESVWWVFRRLFEEGLIYEGYKVMPYSARLGTPLSNFEAGENYRDVDDPSLYVAFRVNETLSLLAWTTTPWTLPSNRALMVSPKITYARVRKGAHEYILAKSRIAVVFDECEILEEFSGSKLVGMHYEPLFDYFKDMEGFSIIAEEAVAEDEGTAIVHCAPAFGEVDFYACQREGIELVLPIDSNGRFTKVIPEYEGQFVKDCDKDIIARLKKKGALIKQATIRHRYPFCWRSDTPLIYRAVTTWFVAVEKIRHKLLKANSQIHWVPGNIKEGRFGKWLEGARDWAISRHRYWGTPIPIWRAEDGSVRVIGSIAELEKRTGAKINDLHRHFIDDLTFKEDGKTYKRIPEVFDCWFESGSMPYSQYHYPFENKELVERGFPADFIAEGLDQTRGWFYTLTVLAAALFDKPAFKNVIVNGIVLAEDGNKMSKRLKNYPEPSAVIEKYGADAIRLYLLGSPAIRADDLRFSERGVEGVLRQVLIPLWNARSFFMTYKEIYKWKPCEIKKPQAALDRWILAKLHELIFDVEKGMELYELDVAVRPLTIFVDQLTNWYIRRTRERFWSDEETLDRKEAFATLYTVLLEFAKVAAPFIPFVAESLYQSLKLEKMPLSVHLCDFPSYSHIMRDNTLEKAMHYVQEVVSAGHALRKEHKLRVRQPLQALLIASSNKEIIDLLKGYEEIICDELNVKRIEYSKEEEKLATTLVKANFKVLGKKVGPLMKAAVALIATFGPKEIATFQKQGYLEITVEGQEIVLEKEDLILERKAYEGLAAASLQDLTLALNTQLTTELILEGLAREFKNKVNTMRKDGGFAVTDRITITIDATPKVKEAILEHLTYLKNELLALDITFEAAPNATLWDLNGEEVRIEVKKA